MSLSLCARTSAIAPSATLAITARANQLKAEGYPVIGFGVGEPDFNTPKHICDAAVEALNKGMTRYTAAAGTLELRKAICDKLLRDNGLSYQPNEIVVSNGAKHALYNICCALINPGDEVLLPAPYWVSYVEMIRLAGGVPVIIEGRPEDDFIVTAEMMRPYVNEKTKALILNSPNNPNGCVWHPDELKAIAELAVEKQFYVISDEIYEKLIYDGEEHVSIASFGDAIKGQTIVVNGVSKSYAMTGWRIGYVAGPAKIMKVISSFQSHTASAPNAMAQYASIEALNGGDESIIAMHDEFDRRRQLIVSLINGIEGLSARKPKGAFYVMMDVSSLFGKSHGGKVIHDVSEFGQALLDSKYVAVVPGVAFGDDRHVRMSYATSSENIREGLRRIAEFVSEIE
ncbi:MAG: pyridoxal phosphate-dependent aminotransferase [Clostridia bacterium]|nr:pyridoxal phosphate-dependent aminotransferase [Clostridia bacterium]